MRAALILATELLARRTASETHVQEMIPRFLDRKAGKYLRMHFPFSEFYRIFGPTSQVLLHVDLPLVIPTHLQPKH